MATPAISGVLSIILQFFHEKWYPYLTKGTGQYINPTSYLLRAFLACISNPNNNYQSGPSFEEGFGIPCLENIFQNGLRIIDTQKIESKSRKSYKVSITSCETDLVITMAYLDPPLSYQSSSLLFADLNLVVVSPSGKYYYGNSPTNADSDSFSTIERIIIPSSEVELGDYQIHIISSEFPLDSDISFAVVVQGGFSQSDTTSNPVFLKEVSVPKYTAECANGSSVNGFCRCYDGYIGFRCNTTITPLNSNVSHLSQLTHKQVNYYHVEKSNSSRNIYVVKLTRQSSQAGYYCLSPDASVFTDGSWSCSSFKTGDTINVNVDDNPYLAVYISDYRSIRVTVSVINSYYESQKHTSLYIIAFVSAIFLIALLSIAAILFIVYRRRAKQYSDEAAQRKQKLIDDLP